MLVCQPNNFFETFFLCIGCEIIGMVIFFCLVIPYLNKKKPSDESHIVNPMDWKASPSVVVPNPIPFSPNSPQEKELGEEVFKVLNNPDVPTSARDVVNRLWFQFVMRDKWYKEN